HSRRLRVVCSATTTSSDARASSRSSPVIVFRICKVSSAGDRKFHGPRVPLRSVALPELVRTGLSHDGRGRVHALVPGPTSPPTYAMNTKNPQPQSFLGLRVLSVTANNR